jgi:hypothetical protein
MNSVDDKSNYGIIAGDIARRMLSYIPDFYRDDDLYQNIVDFLVAVAPSYDYLLEKSQALPQLVDIYRAPSKKAISNSGETFLSLLGRLIGYEWDFNTVEIETQRRILSTILDAYKIRGTIPSILRVVRSSGASIASIYLPIEHLFTLDKSVLDGTDHLPDSEYWRWGTYEIISNESLEPVIKNLNDVHLAGTVRYITRKIQLEQKDQPVAEQTFSIRYATLWSIVVHEEALNITENIPPADLKIKQIISVAPPTETITITDTIPDTQAQFGGYGTGEYGTGDYGRNNDGSEN